jgi:Fe2+ or Zn2+ uptake regulation protein
MVSQDGALPTKPEEISAEVAGLRMTKQRREVYGILLGERDHPTANSIFRRVQEGMPTISLATVYNCLEALVGHGLVKQVNFDREPSRYCPNLTEHVHFQDEVTGKIHDITFREGVDIGDLLDLPEGVQVTDLELTIRGRMPKEG